MYDTYRYNEKKNINAGAKITPETEDTFVKPEKEFRVGLGSIIGSDYDFYASAADAYAAGVHPIAIIVSAPNSYGGNNEVEYGSKYHYMAMALAVTSVLRLGLLTRGALTSVRRARRSTIS